MTSIQLKQHLEFNKSLSGILDVLKIAASVQLRQLQSSALLPETFPRHLEACFQMLASHNEVAHPFLSRRDHRPACHVVVTSEEGFTGELNTLLTEAALNARQAARGDRLVVLGARGASTLEELGESFVYLPGVSGEPGRNEVRRFKNYLVNEYLQGEFGEASVIYAKFISVGSHQIEAKRLLPCPALFGGSESEDEALPIEPTAERVVEGLVSLWLEQTIAAIFRSSKLAELSARLMHLEGSDQELSRINQQLGLRYVRHLHALADKAIREISASRLAGAREYEVSDG
ncbi:MAG: F0F1 ATP synthase subunit gamma [Candidatus Omnitrophica bacterium]|nr:F0F1 ATP synthase subunit gamma [Candidatus Omnitrophota bacterium]MBI3020836.1 F0F1 ATP synthase subunit gamma [Candidatus Omnitrophota bacterium]MBI3083777.1 F0F1 ATP synthase subunit gamma [Candidatus Omnitrophota bacterium]